MSKPKSKMLTLPDSLIMDEICAFLEARDLSAFAQTCTENRNVSQNNCKASELLFYGVNINKERKKKLLELLATQNIPQQNLREQNLGDQNLENLGDRDLSENTEIQSFILRRANVRQVYFSKKLNANVCMGVLGNVSPLEAAVLCGDFHLVRLLLENLPENQNQEAVQQLKRIRRKLESEPNSFASLIKSLQTAYKSYMSLCRTIEKVYSGYINYDYQNKLNKLLGSIGEKQKVLPWFILQMFCIPLLYNPPSPDLLKEEPDRYCRSTLDLDSIGFVSKFGWDSVPYALIKGPLPPWEGICFVYASVSHEMWPKDAEADSMILNSICAVIKSELDTIIKLQEQKLLLAAYPDLEQPSSRSSFPSRSPSPPSSSHI